MAGGWTGSAPNQVFSRSSDVYSGATTWQQTDAASRGIRSDDHDTHDQKLSDGINVCVKKDGGNTLTASIPAGGFGMTGIGVLGSATEASITSASTADLLGSAALFNLITGTVTITSLGTGTNRFKIARFNGILTLTHNATSLILPGGANITTAAGDTMGVISDGSSNARVIWYQRASGAAVGAANTGFAGQLFGLTLSNGTDATNDIDIAAGSARDSTDVDTLVASALTKQLDAAWAVGTNAGGLDTGSIANTTYHIWLIKRPDTGVVDALFSTSASAPTMPTNYTLKRRIGSIVRTGGSIKAFKQDGDRFRWVLAIQDISTTNPGTSAVTATLTLPTGIVVWADVAVYIENVSTVSIAMLVTALDETNSVPSFASGLFNFGIASTAADEINIDNMSVKTNTSAQIRYRLSASGASDLVKIMTLGWTDTRGRLA